MRLAVLLLVLHAAPVYADTPTFTPPAKSAKAQARFRRAEKLFDGKRYDEAAVEFAAAYELDPDAKFLLFNLAVARRLAGKCEQAIDAYRDFLAAKPPDAQAKKAIAGIERCGGTVKPPEPAVQEPPPQPPPVEEKPPPPVIQPAPPPGPAEPRRVVVHVPWYRDTLGDVLAGSGVVVGLVSTFFFAEAHSRASHSFTPSSVNDFLQSRTDAVSLQGLGVITGVVAGALLISGGVRYATRSSERTIVVTPNSVAIGGTF